MPIATKNTRILFRDAGFEPTLENHVITLGPEQLALIGVGSYARAENDLGVQEDVLIPRSIRPIAVNFKPSASDLLEAEFHPPATGRIRLVVQLTEPEKSVARRITGSAPPAGKPIGELLVLSAIQGDQPVPIRIEYNKPIWSGLSWAVGEIDASALQPGVPLKVRFACRASGKVNLAGSAYHVEY